MQVSQTGRWNEWISFFLRGVTEQADDARVRSGRLLDLREDFRIRLQRAGRSARALELADHLFRYPYITVSIAADRVNVSFVGAQRIVDRLVSAGILREATGQPRNRIYVADEIVQVIDE